MNKMHFLKRDIKIEMLESGQMIDKGVRTMKQLVESTIDHTLGVNLTIDNFVDMAFEEIEEQGLGDVSYEYAMALINEKEQDYKRKQMNQAKKDRGFK